MKSWLIALPLLFAFSLAQAEEKPQQKEQPKTDTPPAKVSHAKKYKHSPRHLPKGDLRYCLDLKDNEAIIRCAETGRKH
jgi:hypothetical protein